MVVFSNSFIWREDETNHFIKFLNKRRHRMGGGASIPPPSLYVWNEWNGSYATIYIFINMCFFSLGSTRTVCIYISEFVITISVMLWASHNYMLSCGYYDYCVYYDPFKPFHNAPIFYRKCCVLLIGVQTISWARGWILHKERREENIPWVGRHGKAMDSRVAEGESLHLPKSLKIKFFEALQNHFIAPTSFLKEHYKIIY